MWLIGSLLADVVMDVSSMSQHEYARYGELYASGSVVASLVDDSYDLRSDWVENYLGRLDRFRKRYSVAQPDGILRALLVSTLFHVGWYCYVPSRSREHYTYSLVAVFESSSACHIIVTVPLVAAAFLTEFGDGRALGRRTCSTYVLLEVFVHQRFLHK